MDADGLFVFLLYVGGYALSVVGSCMGFELLRIRTSGSGCNNIASLIVAAQSLYWNAIILPMLFFLTASQNDDRPTPLPLTSADVVTDVVTITLVAGFSIIHVLFLALPLWNPDQVRLWTFYVCGAWHGTAALVLLIVFGFSAWEILVVGWMVALCGGGALFLSRKHWQSFSKTMANAAVYAVLSAISFHLLFNYISANARPTTTALVYVSISMAGMFLVSGLVLVVRRQSQINRLAQVARPLSSMANASSIQHSFAQSVALRWIVFDRLRSSPAKNTSEMRLLVDVKNGCPPVTQLFDNCPAQTVATEMLAYCEVVLAHLRPHLDGKQRQHHRHQHVPSIDHQNSNSPISIYVEPNPNNHASAARPSTAIATTAVAAAAPSRQQWIAPIPRRTSSVRLPKQSKSDVAVADRRRQLTTAVDRLFDLVGLPSVQLLKQHTFLHYELVDSTLFLVTDLSSIATETGGADQLLTLISKGLLFRWTFMGSFCADRLAVHRLIGMDDDPTQHPDRNNTTLSPTILTTAPPASLPHAVQDKPRYVLDRKSSLVSCTLQQQPSLSSQNNPHKSNGKMALSARGLLRRLLRYVRMGNLCTLPPATSPDPTIYLGLLYVQASSGASCILVRKPPSVDNNTTCLLPVVPLTISSDFMTTLTYDQLQASVVKLSTKPNGGDLTSKPMTRWEAAVGRCLDGWRESIGSNVGNRPTLSCRFSKRAALFDFMCHGDSA